MKSFKRTIAGATAALLLVSSIASANVTPLPAGKPAGAKEAALLGLPVFLLGLGVLGAIIAVSVSNSNDNNNVTTPTTSGTGP